MKSKEINITLVIEDHGDGVWVGWIKEIRGIVVQANTEKDVERELIVSLGVMAEYNSGIDI